MTISVNGSANPKTITFNGTPLTKVKFNGTTVWELASDMTWAASTQSGFTVSGMCNNVDYDSESTTPKSSYAIALPAISWGTTRTKTFQPSSSSPLWSNGSGVLSFTFTVGTVGSSSTTSCTLRFSNGVATLSIVPPIGVSSVQTAAANVTRDNYLYA